MLPEQYSDPISYKCYVDYIVLAECKSLEHFLLMRVEARDQARAFVKCRAGRVDVDRFHQQAKIKIIVYSPVMVAPLLRRP
jgi:hypothetical protein